MSKKSINATDIFLAILAILLISVSFYQTWLGLDQIFGGSSFIIALVLSLILLFLLWQIRLVRLKGGSSTGLSWIYFFFASFCFIANFNALYTRFMSTDIYIDKLTEIKTKYNELETNVEGKLNFGVPSQKDRQEIVGELNGLRMQITDPKNQGKGEQSNIILGRIERKLGGKLTPLTPISNTPTGYSDLADRYEQQVLQKMENLSPDEKRLKDDINNSVLKWNRDIQKTLLLSQNNINAIAYGQINQSATEYNKLGSRANEILGNDKSKVTPLPPFSAPGKMGFAFSHALTNFGMSAFLVLAGCVLLDFGLLIILLLMPTDIRNTNNTGSVFNSNKRSGKTLIPKN
jgi:hypothetical protein